MFQAPTTEGKTQAHAAPTALLAPEPERELHPRFAGHACVRLDGVPGSGDTRNLNSLRQHFSDLQRSIGNQAVLRMLSRPSPAIQTKLTINEPGDRYEQEADRVADQVMRMSEPAAASTLWLTSVGEGLRTPACGGACGGECAACKDKKEEEGLLHSKPANQASANLNVDDLFQSAGAEHRATLQRKCACGGSCSSCKSGGMKEDELPTGTIQRQAATGHENSSAPTSEVLPQKLGAGRPLDSSTQSFMESRFDTDFSHVRIHDGSSAASAARSVNALAYTLGQDIVFASGHYAPDSVDGKKLLAHELAHVVQQNPGLGVSSPASGGASVSIQRKEGTQCPQMPTRKGNQAPDFPCVTPLYAGSNELARFYFCLDSDQLFDPSSLSVLDSIVARNPASTRYLVHGYASPEGNSAYNFRLACHRANAIALEVGSVLAARLTQDPPGLKDDRLAAALDAQIETGSRGPTSEFSHEATTQFQDPGQADRVVIVYGEVPTRPGQDPSTEPSCKDAPTHLGDIEPDPGCDAGPPTRDLLHTLLQSGSTKQLKLFEFCFDSDVLSATRPADLAKFAHDQAASAKYVIHGFASITPPAHAPKAEAEYNQRLSCYRAVRVARELLNAGIRSEQIREVIGMGQTDELPGGPDFNQVAIIMAEGGEIQSITEPAGKAHDNAQRHAVLDAALADIRAGQYRQEADTYINFWTCGQTPTVRQAVDRLTINLLPGLDEPRLRKPANGTEEGIGVNTVEISNTALFSDNPVECTMGRLIDMGFHHAMIPTATKDLRHAAGLHLAFLAGLGACVGGNAGAREARNEKFGIDEPLADDPMANVKTRFCAPTPEQTRLLPPLPGEKDRQIPEFQFAPPQFEPRSGTVTGQLDSGQVVANPDQSLLAVSTDVQLKGKPEFFKDYQVGFIQTVIDDTTSVEYESGHRIIQQLPVPIRLSEDPNGIASTAPWAASKATAAPDASGQVPTISFGPSLRSVMAVALGKLELSPPFSAFSNSQRVSHIAMWLVARRLGAPLDRFSVHFIDGRVYEVTQNLRLEHRHARGDLTLPQRLGGEAEIPMFPGSFGVRITSAVAADPRLAQFAGPESSEIDLNRQFMRIIDPPPTTESTGVDFREYAEIVRRILDELVVFPGEAEARAGTAGRVVPRLGFVFSPLMVTVPIDRRTGRHQVPQKQFEIPGKVESPEVDDLVLLELNRILGFRLLNPEFLRRFVGHDVKLKPSALPGNDDVVELRNPLAPMIQGDLVDAPDTGSIVRSDLAKIWACTLRSIGRGKPREWAVAYWMDRDLNLKRIPEDGTLQAGRCCDANQGTCFTEIIAGPRPGGFSVGTIHSHPPGIEEAEPSPDFDRKAAKQGNQGHQFYIISEDSVVEYFSGFPKVQDKVRGLKPGQLPACPNIDEPPC